MKTNDGRGSAIIRNVGQTIILYHDGRGSAIIRNVGYKNLENKAYFEKINIFSYF